VHGFPGSPAQMRFLARTLHQAGWTVQGLRLGGTGAGLAALQRRWRGGWLRAVERAHGELARERETVVLAGFSLGAALVVSAAARRPPAGLVLLSPFCGLRRLLHHSPWPLMHLLHPPASPDLSDAEQRRQLAALLPDVDLDDPRTPERVRRLAGPGSVLGEVFRIGQRTLRLAPRAAAPALIVRGADDALVSHEQARSLAAGLPGPVELLELPGDRAPLAPDSPGWPALAAAVLDFAGGLDDATGLSARLV
jgi:carboxylesterase